MKQAQTYTLRVGTIPVVITRKSVRRINLRVHDDGAVTMSVPWRMGQAAAQTFLDNHAAWLAKHVEAARARNATIYQEGIVPLWGRLAPLPEGLNPEELWKEELEGRLPACTARMEAVTNQHATGWQVRLMKTRWGSCTPSTGMIRINARLAAYPPTCLDYVVAHELTHLAEPSHNEKFHLLLALAYPNEAHARALLRCDPFALADKPDRQTSE